MGDAAIYVIFLNGKELDTLFLRDLAVSAYRRLKAGNTRKYRSLAKLNLLITIYNRRLCVFLEVTAET